MSVLQEGYNVGVVATIPISTALSDVIDLGAGTIVGIIMPSAWDAAAITLQTKMTEAGTLANVYDKSGSEYSITVAASSHVILDPTILRGLGRYVKLRSGTAALAVNQTAARSITVLIRVVE